MLFVAAVVVVSSLTVLVETELFVVTSLTEATGVAVADVSGSAVGVGVSKATLDTEEAETDDLDRNLWIRVTFGIVNVLPENEVEVVLAVPCTDSQIVILYHEILRPVLCLYLVLARN
mmetsp:Transcript_25077/g.37504  ORF Transcript_25077/g.37504 Transcript_25077/m.37504 type:complete len:118 (-) Transcript_25077:46-399(-)